MIKNIKKRTVSESSKTDEAPKGKLNKPMKQLKVENKNEAQNGQTVIPKKFNKPNKKGQDKKQGQNVGKKETKLPSAENSAGKKPNQTEVTDELKKAQSKLPAKKDELTVEQLKEKITEMESRPSLSKTAKKKLTVFKKKLSIIEGKDSGEVSAKQTEVKSESTKKQEKTKPTKGNIKKDHPQGSLSIKKEEDDEDDDEEEEEEMELSEEEDDDVDDEEDEEEVDDEEEEDDDEDDDEDEEENEVKPPQKKQKGDESQNKKSTEKGKKKRYTLFVGNIPYSATEDEIKKHFLTKVSEVVCVRIPVKEGTNEPRGFAYVEFANNTDFEKAFSLHLSTLGGRRINVQFATRQKGVKKEGVAKNLKLHALRKAGKLAGSHKKNQKNVGMKGKQNAKPVQT